MNISLFKSGPGIKTEPTLNATVVEEKIVCAFTPKKVSAPFKKEHIVDFDKDIQEDEICQRTTSEHNKIINNSQNLEQKTQTLTACESIQLNLQQEELINPTNKSDSLNIETQPLQSFKDSQVKLEEEFIYSNYKSDSIRTESVQINSFSPIVIMKPKKMAPTAEEVFNSLDKYAIPHVKQQLPFYGNIQDVGGSTKLPHTVLKVNGRSTSYLPEFQSQTNGLSNFRKNVLDSLSYIVPDNKCALNNIALSFCKFVTCIVKPVKEPPTPEEVRKWLKTKQLKKKPQKKEELRKSKLHVPLTLGGKNDEDMDLSLSLSLSCSESQPSQKLDDFQSDSHQSSVSSQTSDGSDKQIAKFSNKNQSSSSYDSCLISGVSINDTYAFRKPTEDLKEVRAFVEHQYITVMVMELHVLTRRDFKPDPSQDPIQAIFYSVFNDVPENNTKPSKYRGAVVLNSLESKKTDDNVPLLDGVGIACDIVYVDTEANLFKEFVNIVNYWDPDIVAGYEIEMLSWGYLIERGAALEIKVKHTLGRNSLEEPKRRGDDHARELKLIGRIVLDVWRLMRHEIALQSYTFESVVYHILHKRVPNYNFKTLTQWWDHDTNLYRHRTVKYYLVRVDTVLELFDKLDFINRTSELAR